MLLPYPFCFSGRPIVRHNDDCSMVTKRWLHDHARKTGVHNRVCFAGWSKCPIASIGTEAADVLSLFRYPASIGDGQQEINPALGVLLLSIYKHSE